MLLNLVKELSLKKNGTGSKAKLLGVAEENRERYKKY